MKGLYSVLPPFAPDYSGVSSVFFELGGVMVINGADGCTGNVTGYDEPRFYSSTACVYSSGLRELNAVTGDESFIVERLKNEKGKFIALASTPTPAVIGMDQRAIAQKISTELGVPVYHFDTTGTYTYEKGASEAFARIAENMLIDMDEKIDNSVNLLGAIPLDYWNEVQIENIKEALIKRGIHINACWAMGSSLEEIRHSLKAQMNLVLSISALKAAKIMKEMYNISYVIGVPIGRGYSDVVADKIKQNLGSDMEKKEVIKKASNVKKMLIIGEQILANSIRKAVKLEYDIEDIKVASFFHMDKDLMESTDKFIDSEDSFEELLRKSDYDLIVGDPLFKIFLSPTEKKNYVELPHLAVSSRLYWDNYVCYTGEAGMEFLRSSL
ncbi:nitrogenase component 1 [Paramaledivibacter caminithermalis]|jgi:nitrogenase molybdenum-iron protein alpha/beta subunit|uniref:Nitrogenase molybdenum-iron protein, alpha and beta chains n=1 Tax=Paramaledivibacter caminithermalis (strain DSM 15212 / CIP 107654 / DViRD3) TaxID=1121301 RepID=A0A1M6P2I4_PARC5|nr:nitrogenase component 1 [Paramaledivibacter caminithermalis]SHK02141.1 Nitrogenase molybdenum-iron protein, alpha and beta chains [Paramaledivibacter caminithermalis DSM 15212]